jgi:aconitate hydratase
MREIWPTQNEIAQTLKTSLDPEMYREKYSQVFEGDENWKEMHVEGGKSYQWESQSTYIKNPPFFTDITMEKPPLANIQDARVLALLGDSVTTDHISPAGSIQPKSPAGQYLISQGVEVKDFNSYGSRRGNHEVMMRGTFANIRIKNRLLEGVEGGYTEYLPSGDQMAIYDAAMAYKKQQIPLIVIAGKEYGTGSSRDWAAKGTYLLGIKAVIAESFERIHRSNLVGMGVLPLQFKSGDNYQKLGLSGREVFNITGIEEGLKPRQELTVKAINENGQETSFQALSRLDTAVDIVYYENGGILHTVLRDMMR